MRSVLVATLLAGVTLGSVPLGAHAQGAAPAETRARADALEKLQGMQSTGTAEAPEIPQTGRRANEIMNVVAKGLSDAEIADLAAFYAGISIEVLPPG